MDQQSLIYLLIAIVMFILLGGGVYYYMKHKNENFTNSNNVITIYSNFVYKYGIYNGIIHVFNDLKGNMFFTYEIKNLSHFIPLEIKTKNDYAFEYNDNGTITYILSGFPDDDKTHTFEVNYKNNEIKIDSVAQPINNSSDLFESRIEINTYEKNMYMIIDNGELEKTHPSFKWCELYYDSDKNKWKLYNAKKDDKFIENTKFQILSRWLNKDEFKLSVIVELPDESSFSMNFDIDILNKQISSKDVIINSFKFE
jgi:hypothetical protein